METGRRTQLLTYLLLIAINLAVLPNWFSPGAVQLGPRLVLMVLNVGIIAFCAWRVSRILGVNPFSRLKRPRYAPYEPPYEDVDESVDQGVDDRDGAGRGRGGRAFVERSFGQAGQFEEYDPYDEAPGAGSPQDRPPEP